MNNKPRFGFVVEYVKDIEAAKNFYIDVLGLEMQRYHPTFVQFDKFAIASDQPIGATGEPGALIGSSTTAKPLTASCRRRLTWSRRWRRSRSAKSSRSKMRMGDRDICSSSPGIARAGL